MESVVKLNRKLGVGGRGVVYEGFDHAKGQFVAIKEMPYMEPSVAGEEGEEDSALAEIASELACMRVARHPNLVEYYGARRSAIGVQIIMEYVSGGSLDYVLTRCGPLRECVAKAYTQDVLAALQYLHEEMHVCHRDVKPANILISPDGRCKLADFGVAKQVEEDRTRGAPSSGIAASGREGYLQTAVGTPWYMAPEVINGGIDDDDDDEEEENDGEGRDGTVPSDEPHGCFPANGKASSSASGSLVDWSNAEPTGSLASPAPSPPPLYASGSYYNPLKNIIRKGRLSRGTVGYTTRADIWSVGVTVYEMITGTRPFGADLHNPSAIMFRIANCATAPPRLPAHVQASPELQSFLDLCFVYDKNLRATARELLGHPWLRSADRRGRHSPPLQQREQQSVFGGVPLLDAVDLPAYHPAAAVSASCSASLCSAARCVDGGERAGSSQQPPHHHHNGHHHHEQQQQQQLNHPQGSSHRSNADGVVAGRRRRLSESGVARLSSSSGSGQLPFLTSPANVTAAEQAEAASRYATARSRIGRTRASGPSASPAPPTSGGVQTRYGAFADLLSHP